MRLRSIDAALAEMEEVRGVGDRFVEVQMMLNVFAAAVRKLPRELRLAVIRDTKAEIAAWCDAGVPEIDITTGRFTFGNKRSVTEAVKDWLADNPDGGTADEIYEAVKDAFETTSNDRRTIVGGCLRRMRDARGGLVNVSHTSPPVYNATADLLRQYDK